MPTQRSVATAACQTTTGSLEGSSSPSSDRNERVKPAPIGEGICLMPVMKDDDEQPPADAQPPADEEQDDSDSSDEDEAPQQTPTLCPQQIEAATRSPQLD